MLWQSFSQECISVMEIEGLPVIDVDESEEITVACTGRWEGESIIPLSNDTSLKES
jgi:hypothetical protein